MPPQEKLDEAAKLKVEASYGKLPKSFIRNDGQLNKQVQYYERGAGHATYFTKQGVYLSLVGGRTSVPLVSEQLAVDSSQTNEASRLSQNVSVQAASLNQRGMGYGPRITENGIQSNPKTLDLFLISYREPLSQIQSQQTSNNTRTNDPCSRHTGTGFVHATPVNELKSETCGEQSRTIQNPRSEIVKLLPLGIEKDVEIVAGKEQTGKVNYLIGNDPKKWKTNIPMYESVVYKGVYDGIDMKFYGNNCQMEYDIIVKPGASPSRVQLSYEGIEGLTVAENGDLEISLKEGKLIQKKPYVYQEIDGKRVEVEGKFKIRNPKSEIRNSQYVYGFAVASYDKRYPLVIDPVLVYSTYLGGSDEDQGYGIAVDSAGNAYVTGYTDSNDFPMASPYDDGSFGLRDAFVTKFNASGNALVYSTYLGGSGGARGTGIAVDAAGNAYVTGDTGSSDFPMASPYDGSYNGESDAFVTKLDASGGNLVYSTYLGGSSFELSTRIAVDAAGNAYVTGETWSSDFPTVSPYDGSYNGGPDAFVTKLNVSGNALVYSTYLGGSHKDLGYGIAVDAAGNAYVTGYTWSSDFPTVSPYDGSLIADDVDAFVTKFNASGSTLVYSTYLGGSDHDQGYGIAVDAAGNAYVTGETVSPDFPTVSPYDGSLASASGDVFVTKLDASGGNLVYSTYLGGSDEDRSNGIAVDAAGNAYVTGVTVSPDFPTVSPYDGSHNYDYFFPEDVFVCKFGASESPTAITLAYFHAKAGKDGRVTLAWETATEVDNAGFNLYRSRCKDGPYKKINDNLIPAQGNATSGAGYSYIDTPSAKGRYYYKLEDIDYNGVSTMHGPKKVKVMSLCKR